MNMDKYIYTSPRPHQETNGYGGPAQTAASPEQESMHSDHINNENVMQTPGTTPVWRPRPQSGRSSGGEYDPLKPHFKQNPRRRTRIICAVLTLLISAALAAGVYCGVKALSNSKNKDKLDISGRKISGKGDGGPAICSDKGVLSILSSESSRPGDKFSNPVDGINLPTGLVNNSSKMVIQLEFASPEVDPILQEVVKAFNTTGDQTYDLYHVEPQQIIKFLSDKVTGGWIYGNYSSWLSQLPLTSRTATTLTKVDLFQSISRFYYGPYSHVLLVEFTGINQGIAEALVTALQAHTDLVKWAQVERRIFKAATLTQVDDPEADKMWGINSIGVLPQAGLTVPPAWTITTGSKSIVVAIMDSGADSQHPDLAPNIWINRAEYDGEPGEDNDNNNYMDDVIGWNFLDGTPDVTDEDGNGHGTHVAGIIGAAANNGKFGVGVAPVVSLMICKVLGKNGVGNNGALLHAMEYALANGAHITSHSLGTDGQGPDPLIQAVVKKAEQMGQLLVAAAGNFRRNNDVDPMYPASYKEDNVISVGWMDRHGCMAKDGNYGKESVHLVAPGSSILSTFPTYTPSPIKVLGMARLGGSSQAVPHVTGAAVLVLAMWKAQGKSYQGQAKTLKQVLLDSVDKDPLYEDFTVTGGRLNVARALALASNTTLPPQPSSGALTLHSSSTPILCLAAAIIGMALQVLLLF